MGSKKEKQDSALAKKYISTALLLLMEQNDYQNITVTDIAKKAGVSRMTYYRAYSSKEDILIQYFNDVSDGFFQKIASHPNISLYQLAVYFFTFFQEHSSLIPILKKANLLELMLHNCIDNLRNFLLDYSKKQPLSASANYHLYFNIGGLSFALLLWSEGGYKETPEQMAQMIAPFMAPPAHSDNEHSNLF